MRRKDTWLVKIAKWVENYWAQFLTAFGSLGLALSGIMPGVQTKGWDWLRSEPYGLIFLASSLMTLVGGVMTWHQTPGIPALQDKVARLEDELEHSRKGFYELLDYELQLLFESNGLTSTDRISIYKHEGHVFTMLGRYSSNPEYQKTGRGIYPDSEGCIGKAWREGKAFLGELPKPGTRLFYSVLEKEWNIIQEVADSLRMPSRCYAAFGINDSKGRRIAVIVFESTQPNGIKNAAIEKALQDGEERRLNLFLEKMHSIEPASTYALEQGF